MSLTGHSYLKAGDFTKCVAIEIGCDIAQARRRTSFGGGGHFSSFWRPARCSTSATQAEHPFSSATFTHQPTNGDQPCACVFGESEGKAEAGDAAGLGGGISAKADARCVIHVGVLEIATVRMRAAAVKKGSAATSPPPLAHIPLRQECATFGNFAHF